MKFKLVEKRDEVGDVHTWVWESEQPVNWVAGQFIQYTLDHPNPDDRGTQRWFTIAAAPYEQNPHITTRFNEERSSSFKQALMAMKPGDEIEAGEPEGDFVFEHPEKKHVFIAGGIGVTPFRSILWQLKHDGELPDITLLYSNKSDQIVLKDKLDAMVSDKFKVEYIMDPGRIDAAKIKSLPDWQNLIYYVSGPEPMVEAMVEMFKELGVPETQVKGDYFPNYKADLS